MKAAAFFSPGPAEVLQLTELDAPTAGAGEVRVRVHTAGVQVTDAAIRQGWTPPGATLTSPQIPGNEFAGIVDQLGEDVTGFALGDEVLGFKVLTCYAKYVVAPAEQIVPKPAGMPWIQAGSLSASGQTAHTALQELRVTSGDTVLIHGAAGGVGSIAVQLARLWGAAVVGTAGEDNHEYLRSLGAVPVMYGDGLAARVRVAAPDGVDAALDAAGRGALEASLDLVTDTSRIGTLVEYERGPQLGIRFLRSQRSAARLAELTDLHTRGLLHVHVRKSFPLQHAADAHREVETGHGRGKVVLTAGEDAR